MPPPRSPSPLISLLATLLFLVHAATAFVPLSTTPNTVRRRCRRPQHAAAVALSVSAGGLSAAQVEEKMEKVWATDVPSSLGAIITEAQNSLAAALGAGETRLRIDIRTPGLDEQFEQTAIREKALLLGVVEAFFPLFAGKKTKVLFESEGEAAMAAKAYTNGFDIPDSITFGGLTPRAIAPDDQVIFLVEPTNRPGSPVIVTVEELLAAHPDKTFVMYNPNLETSGASLGIRERDRRQLFLDSFRSAYIYLCLASLSRPALIPRELGALHYRFEEGSYRLLRCLLPEDGPGSLNRFFGKNKRVYASSPLTPTAANPPKMYTVAEYASCPQAEELARAMEGSEAVLESLIRQMTDNIETTEEARAVLVEAAKTRGVDPGKVQSAIDFLEKNSRKGKKAPEDEQKQADELRRLIAGRWRLIFTTGTKGTQAKMGKINYFPVKAVQSFAALPSSDYSNNIYLGSWPAVQVLGSFECPKFRKLEFKVESIKLGPIGFGSKGEGFFTFFFVDDAIAVARGQGGGLALWYKETE